MKKSYNVRIPKYISKTTTSVCVVKCRVKKDRSDEREKEYSFLACLYEDMVFEYVCEGQKENDYLVNYKIFADGRLVSLGRYRISLLEELISLKVLGDKRILIICSEKEDYTHMVRNPSFAWREEGNNLVSIYRENGDVVFLKSILAKWWLLSDGSRLVTDYLEVPLKNGELYKVIELFVKRNLVLLYKEI